MVGLLMFVVLVAMVIAPLAFRAWQERLDDRGLALRAEVDAALRRRLHGESLLGVQVVAATPWRTGRVELSVPSGWDPVLAHVSDTILARVPADYELVVHRFGSPRAVTAAA